MPVGSASCPRTLGCEPNDGRGRIPGWGPGERGRRDHATQPADGTDLRYHRAQEESPPMPPTQQWQDLMQDSEELISLPLHDFTCDADLVMFDDRVFLRRMDDVDREGLRLSYNPFGRDESSSFVAYVTDSITWNWTHCVSIRFGPGDAIGPAFERMRSVVTALHILHSGPVSVPLNYQMQRNVKRVTGGTIVRMLPFVRFPSYHLGAGELESLRRIHAAHEAVTEHGYRLATRRLDLSYDRIQEEDRLLDVWIALEALFAPDGRRGEITYKISRRIPFFLSTERARRLDIAACVRRSYDARSNIVHGDSTADLKSVGDETEELLRSTLQRWLLLEGSNKPAEVVKVIDDSMFGQPGDGASSGK
jgi:hypothetical protein